MDYLINNLTDKYINDIIYYLTNGTGNILLNDINFTYHNLLNKVNISFKINNVSLILLNSFDYINILKPQTPIILRNRLKMHNMYTMIPFAIRLDHDNKTSTEQFNFFTNIRNLSTDLNVSLILNKTFLSTLNLVQIINYNCLYNSVIDINSSRRGFDFNISKINFTSGRSHTDFIYQFVSIINNAIILFINEYQSVLPAFYMAYAVDPLMMYFNDVFNNYTSQCIEPSTLINNVSVYILLSVALLFSVFAILVFIIIEYNMRKNEWKLLPNSTSDTSILFTNNINIIMRGGILISIIINIFLFIYSNMSIGASLYIKIFMNDNQTNYIISPALFSFSFFGSIKDIWDAKLYYIAVLIFILSGIWPYVKLILMILCWTLPINRLQIKSRGRILEILDFLGKWSLIDVFLLIIMMCVFNINVNMRHLITFNSFINPEAGIHSFIIGVILSSIICHLILFFHNREIKKIVLDDNDQKISFINKFTNINNSYRLTTSGTYLLLGSWFTSIILLIIGICINSFSFHIEGYAGIILKYLGSATYTYHSVISLIMYLPYYSEYPNSFSIRYIQLFLFGFSSVLPILLIILISVLLLYPLNKKNQRILLNIAEYIRVSSIIEVFLLSIIISVFLLGIFVDFVVENYCNHYINKYFIWIINTNKCFGIRADFLSGFWVLLLSTIFHIIISNILLMAFNYSLYNHNKKIIGLQYIINMCVLCNILC
jgi:hypothetical protein